MTVALVLAGEAGAGLCGQLAALGVRRVDAADRAGPGLLTVAAAARSTAERLLICIGEDTVPEEILARLLEAGSTAAFTGVTGPVRTRIPRPSGDAPGWVPGSGGALIVDPPDLDALAGAAEDLAAAPAAAGALLTELTRRGVAVRIIDAGPGSEGGLARLADPAARDVARFAAGRELGPGALYGMALGLGLLSALWFSELAVRAKLLATVTLAVSFLVARAGSVLAASGRDGRVRPAVAWLGAACGLLTEFAVYAALAASAAVPSAAAAPRAAGAGAVAGLDGPFGGALRSTFLASWGGAGQAGVWRLAIVAMILVGVRQLAALGHEYTARSPGNLFSRRRVRTLEQAAALPAGERFAVIVVTAIFFGPRLTFLVLLAWGAVAAGYVLAARLSRPAELSGPEPGGPEPGGPELAGTGGGLVAYRGDGIVSRWLGGLVQGRLPPLPPVLVGLFVTCMLTITGLGDLPAVLLLVPVEAMLLAGFGSRHPHDGRADWLVPALLAAGECVFLAALGLTHRVAPALVFALLAAVIIRHVDVAYRARVGQGLPADVFGLGWDGRMILVGLAAAFGLAPFAYAVISGYLWVLFGWDFLSGWLAARNS